MLHHRLRTRQLGHSEVLHDVKNGFPSPKHTELTRHVQEDCLPGDVTMLTDRHLLARILTHGAEGKQVLSRSGSGNAQGDSIAALQFCEIYNKRIQAWMDRVYTTTDWGGFFVVQDPFSHAIVDTSTTSFVDDVARTHQHDTEVELGRQLGPSDEVMDDEFDRLCIMGHPDEREFFTRFLTSRAHPASKRRMRAFYSGPPSFPGKRRLTGRYLGAMFSASGSRQADRAHRLKAAKAGWYAGKRVWTTTKHPWKLKRIMFRSLVESSVLPGQEAECWTRADRALDEFAFNRGKLLKGVRDHGNATLRQDGTWTSESRENLRRSMELPTGRSRLQARRISWLKDMIRHPNETTTLRATLFGAYSWDGAPLRGQRCPSERRGALAPSAGPRPSSTHPAALRLPEGPHLTPRPARGG